MPAEKREGDVVFAGTINETGALVISAPITIVAAIGSASRRRAACSSKAVSISSSSASVQMITHDLQFHEI